MNFQVVEVDGGNQERVRVKQFLYEVMRGRDRVSQVMDRKRLLIKELGHMLLPRATGI